MDVPEAIPLPTLSYADIHGPTSFLKNLNGTVTQISGVLRLLLTGDPGFGDLIHDITTIICNIHILYFFFLIQ